MSAALAWMRVLIAEKKISSPRGGVVRIANKRWDLDVCHWGNAAERVGPRSREVG